MITGISVPVVYCILFNYVIMFIDRLIDTIGFYILVNTILLIKKLVIEKLRGSQAKKS